MTTQQILISGILLMTLLAFVWGRWRYDLVAMFALVSSVLAGIVEPNQAFEGFGHPAVITVAAVLIISSALRNAGVVDEVASRISHLTETPLLHIAALTAVVTVASAFMNNVGALALMLPIAMSTAQERKRSPSLILMPLAFGSLLGGMMTLIGTPPNIIIASIRAKESGEPFGMFDFMPVGLPIAIVGFAFVTLIGWRLIPRARLEFKEDASLLAAGVYLTEALVPATSSLVGKTLGEIDGLDEDSVEVIGVAGKRRFARAVRAEYQIAEEDILILRARSDDLKSFLDRHGLELRSTATPTFIQPSPDNEVMAEGIVRNDSPLIGRGVEFIRRQTGRTLALVGLARQGRPVTQRLRQQVFRAGDVLLLHGDSESVDQQFGALGLWPLMRRQINLNRTRKIALASGIFALAIVLGIAGVVTLPIAFILAVGAYVLTGILSTREIYDDIDWPVIVLLAAMIPVGNALTTSGTTQLVADSLIQATQGLSIPMILTLLLVVTMLLSDVINNAATALVMAPLGIAMAHSLGVSVDPFLMAVAVGASCAFLTPIGHQCNTLVMGPGGYKFSDYWRMGLPLEILITIISVPTILWAWPLSG
ncbi:SLC13 family permease [Granulosicoccus antarcticus]|uniref:Putative transporter n=1 Tax=Granulosicoccus antarcticus IMCC3135 TaxID=1192854 RepID=A0A2Z2P2G0_9GAMM|nr:SLC13 family permease [Granulosicoccus antarcticus]ASJ76498.1 putative transporter [Granulosicoccus antarcticus IMCC3135]